MSGKLSDYIEGRNNNFNLIRFVAASLVLLSHCYPLTGHPRNEPLAPFGLSLGDVAVDIFFLTSGFLVSASLLKSTHVGNFILARMLRIYPGLVIANAIIVFVIGLYFTTFSAQDYLTTPLIYDCVKANSILFFSSLKQELPGVFLSLPYPRAINGSLWTLRTEVTLYAQLSLIGLIAVIFPRIMNRSFLVCIFMCVAIFFFVQSINDAHNPTLILKILFYIGGIHYILANKIRLNSFLFIALAVMVMLSVFFKVATTPMIILGLCYLVLYLAYVPTGKIRAFNRWGDYSYGIYIYAWPIQQAVLSFIPSVTPLGLAAIAYPIVLVIAIFSWKLIENPMLGLKHRFARSSRNKKTSASASA